MAERFFHGILMIGLAMLLLWVSLFFGWQVLAKTNFAYPLLYEVINIDENITKFGPQNRYKKNFSMTTKEERIRLFSLIVEAINNDGAGLKDIHYHDAEGNSLGALLRQPEVVHLQDVANLLSTLRSVSYSAIVLSSVIFVFVWWRKRPLFRTRIVLLITLGITITSVFLVMLFGAKDVFYKGHTLVFPEGHQWFFYYQDSLMTTLMKAPMIFSYIAALLLTTALLFFILIWFVLYRVSVRPH